MSNNHNTNNRQSIKEKLQAALYYAKRGWLVFALHYILLSGKCCCGKVDCSSPGKRPWTNNGYKDATVDTQQIEAWWFQKYKNANIGIATGKISGFFVVDIDPRNGGDVSLELLENEYGALPDTVEALTGGGGRHLYFKYPLMGYINCTNGVIARGIDIKGDGGYVVAPPSNHESGNNYEWEGSSHPDDVEIAEAPEWLLKLLASHQRAEPKRRSAETENRTISEGSRNATLTSLAGGMRRHGMSKESIVAALMKENCKCNPPLPVDEVKSIATSVSRYPPAKRDEIIQELAKLSVVDYETRRLDEAKSLGLRATVLDKQVCHYRKASEKQDNPLDETLTDPTPWSDVVDGVNLLVDLNKIIDKYLVVLPTGTVAIALWVIFSFAHGAFYFSPILSFISPDKRCGKTTALGILLYLVRRPLQTSNITSSALFRSIDKWKPTLIIDEADTFLTNNEELRGILNSGHTKSNAFVIRTVGDDYEPTHFNTWAPKAIAKIGKLPATLEDRSICVPMKRKLATEHVSRFRQDRVDEFKILQRKCMRWVNDNLEAIAARDPAIPNGLNDRAADSWRPLFAIADQVGGNWPKQARDAAQVLSAEREDETAGIMLLEDIKHLFERSKFEPTKRISSNELVEDLVKMEHRPWPEWKRGHPITTRQVAKLLSPFGIKPKSVRLDGKTPKGYERPQFNDAFQRYLNNQSATPQQTNNNDMLSPNLSATQELSVAVNNDKKLFENNNVAVLRFNQGDGDEDAGETEDFYP